MSESAYSDARGQGDPSGGTFGYFANRPSAVFDQVCLQADYALRAILSFYRFRQLGGTYETREVDHENEDDKKKRQKKNRGIGIHYVSDHPPVRIFNLSIIALLVLMESAANAYFFGVQSDFGIVGGMLQAAAVSMSNVAIAYFIIGFWGLRHASVPWTEFHTTKKIFGIGAIIIGLMLVIAVNLSAAHYRNLLDLKAVSEPSITAQQTAAELGVAAASVDTATGDVATRTFFPLLEGHCRRVLGSELGQDPVSAAANALCQPLNIHSMDAMILFALGMVIAAFAAFEGRRSDAAFPGFSDAARKVERSREDLQDALEEYYESYEDVVEEINAAINEHAKGGGAPGDDTLSRFTMQNRLDLFAALDARVAPYRSLLETPKEQLQYEFAVGDSAVEAYDLPHLRSKKTGGVA